MRIMWGVDEVDLRRVVLIGTLKIKSWWEEEIADDWVWRPGLGRILKTQLTKTAADDGLQGLESPCSAPFCSGCAS